MFEYFLFLFLMPRLHGENLHLAVLVPSDKLDINCTKSAIQMAIDDINKLPNFIVHNNVSFSLHAHFVSSDFEVASIIEAQHFLYKHNPIKIVTIGPPYMVQNEYCIDFATAHGNLLFSYSDAGNEPLKDFFQLYFTTTPSIVSSFIAVKSFITKFNWTKVGIIYDYSDDHYLKNADNLREVLENGDSPVKILSFQGILSLQVSYKMESVFEELQRKGVRIIIALQSVYGARKIFCEAYRRKMLLPKMIWLLFEILPNDWATNNYSYGETDGCTEKQLHDAANGFITFTKQTLREDNVTTLSNITSADFMRRLYDSAGRICDRAAAYAYDAVWLSALSLKNMAINLNLSTYNYTTDFGINFEFPLKLAEYTKEISFEAITGPLSYKIQLEKGTYYARIGQISIHVHHAESTFVGLHDTSSNTLKLEPYATNILFGDNLVLNDQPTYVTELTSFPFSLLLTFWLIASVGIFVSLWFISFSVTNLIGSMRYLYFLLTLGVIFCYLSVIVYGIDTRFIDIKLLPAMCTTFTWSLSIGFTLMFGSLLSKVWINYKTTTLLANNYLTGYSGKTVMKFIQWPTLFGGFLLVDIGILTSWITIAPFKEVIRNTTISDPFIDNTIKISQVAFCTSKFSKEFIIAIYCFKGCMLLFGLFFVWQTPSKKKTNNIALSIYSVVFASLVVVITTAVISNKSNYNIIYTIVGIGIFACTATTLLLIFVPEIKKVIGRGKNTD